MVVNLYIRCAAGTKPTKRFVFEHDTSKNENLKYRDKSKVRDTYSINLTHSNDASFQHFAMVLILALILISVYSSNGVKLQNCQRNQIKFEKIIGLHPPDSFHPLLLHEDRSNNPITITCIEKCSENDECLSFVLFYKNSSCFWFRNEILSFHEEESVLDPNVAWFTKTCLTGATECNKQWAFERVPGAALVGNDTKKLPNLVSRNECQQHCLNETTFECRSAKFRVQPTTTFYDGNLVLPNYNKDTLGICILSNTDRFLTANSYRVSSYDEEYLENQCTKTISNEFCAFEEFEDVILAHVDMVYTNLTKQLCQKQCDSIITFKCRGFSLLPTNRVLIENQRFTCLLHSENSKLHGPKMLQDHPGAKYYERAPCLNITVMCNKQTMQIRFTPEVSYNGRLYMKGFSDSPECYALGNYTSVVTLEIPLLAHKCGIVKVDSPINRTLMSSTMVLQYNSLVQTQADRIIKVGCIFTNSTKVVVGAGFNFTDDHASSGSSIVNSTTPQPTVEMRILDLNSRDEVSDTQIGDELQLIIEMKPANSGIDIWAGHLVAMTETGQDSILLLDDRGCPTNLEVFPKLQKETTNSTVILTSTFQAFKFSSSNIIRFSVIVQFCANQCPPVVCNGETYYNKKKREITHLGGSVKTVNRSQFEEEGMKVVKKMPLEFILIVRNTYLQPDKLVYGENNKILVAGYDYLNNEVCIDYSLLIGIVITWILLQIILLISCIVLLRKYKNYYEQQSRTQSLEELHKNFGLGFSNLEGTRRVHFEDGHLT